MKNAILFVLFCAFYLITNSQIDDMSRQKDIFFQDDFSFSLFFKTNGWGLDFKRSYFVNLKQKNYFEVSYNTIKHVKEYKQESYYKFFETYVYGKLNQVYNFNAGIGRQFTIVDKREKGTIEIQIHSSIGGQIAILKPIYYEIIVSTTPVLETDYEKYRPAHQPGLIMGKAPFKYGLDEIFINYGFYLKLGTSFEHSKNIKSISAIEAGLKIEYFFNKLEIMAETPNFNLIPSLYIGYRIGKIIKTTNKKTEKSIN